MQLRRLPTSPDVERFVARDLAPFPSASWIASHAPSVVTWACAMRDGRPNLPHVASWRVDASEPDGTDVRVIHELSRMHHWCAYALSAHIESEHAQSWCELLANEIDAFAQTWPAERGAHWAFPMGTSIRVYSMLVAWDWARRAGWNEERMHRRIAALAIDHATSVWVRRERRGGLSTSHYAANLLGLLAVARYLPHESSSKEWGEFAAKELRRELQRQVLDDGMTNEASTGYHRQIIDLFVHGRSLMGDYRVAAGWNADDDRRLDRGVARLAHLERIGMPLIGDNDDGLVMKLTGFQPNCAWLRDQVPTIQPVDQHMPNFGLYVFSEGGFSATFRNGSVGQFGKGGHAHQDQNSITVCVDGKAFIVDPGSSVYTRDVALRNQERHVSLHATMWWTDLDQAEALTDASGLFWLLADRVAAEVISVDATQISARVAHEDGHEHIRELRLDSVGLHVHDHCRGGSSNVCTWFPLHPDVSIEHVESNLILLLRDGIACEFRWSAGSLSIDDIHVAPSYGVRVPTRRLTIEGARDLHWSLCRRA